MLGVVGFCIELIFPCPTDVRVSRRRKWESIISATKGPYEVTTKENGCIIFISARDDGGLLYTSKHAVGGAPSEAPTGISHAEVGYRWLTKHLSDVGKTEEDFAAALRQADLTAVFEVRDVAILFAFDVFVKRETLLLYLSRREIPYACSSFVTTSLRSTSYLTRAPIAVCTCMG